MRTAGRAILIVDVRCADRTQRSCRGTLTRPERASLNSIGYFYDVSGAPEARAFTARADRPDRLLLTLASKSAGEAPDRMFLEVLDATHATLRPDHAGVPAFPMRRSETGEVLGPGWQRGTRYPIDPLWPSNAEAKRLLEADQAPRVSDQPIDWDKLGAEDAKRRLRIREMLDAGLLRSGNDFFHAALIFQHGDQPEDYLLAHSFAIVAAARGRSDAAWIAAATLDRYLQSANQSQVYGTQYQNADGGPATQDPYSRTLIPDSLRLGMGVPPLAEQERRRAEMSAQNHKH